MASCGRVVLGLPTDGPNFPRQKRRVANPPQVANLPYIAPEKRVDLAERWPLTACGVAALWGKSRTQSLACRAHDRTIDRTTRAGSIVRRCFQSTSPVSMKWQRERTVYTGGVRRVSGESRRTLAR